MVKSIICTTFEILLLTFLHGGISEPYKYPVNVSSIEEVRRIELSNMSNKERKKKRCTLVISDKKITTVLAKKRKKIAKYTLEIFKERANEVHGKGRYDYSHIIASDIKNSKSKVTVICHRHDDEYEEPFSWTPIITNHINGDSRCPECSNNVPMTYERAISKSKKIHGRDTYDYSDMG